MKNITSFVMAILLLVGASTVSAQIPSIGTEYYIENGCMPKQNNGIERTGLVLTDKDAADVNITVDVWNIVRNKDKQIWTVTEDGYIVNKASGRKISYGPSSCYSTNSTGVKFTFVGLIYPAGFVTVTREGQILNKMSAYNGGSGLTAWKIFDQSLPSAYEGIAQYDGSPRAWKFIPVAEYEARPYPQLSTTGSNNWYFIANTGKSGKVLATNGSNLELVNKSADNNSDAQLWKVVAATDDNKIYIINKATGEYLDKSGTDVVMNTLLPSVPLTVKGVRTDELSLTWKDGDGRVSIVADATTDVIVQGEPYLGVDGTTWTFISAGSTDISSIVTDNIRIIVENGYVQVENSNEPFEIYSISGNKMNVSQQLSAGIYIIRVAGKTLKLAVK